MSDKKTLLEEGTVRRFMKLANMEAMGTGFVNEMYAKKDDELDEGRGRKKADDEERPMKEETDLEEDVDLEERATAPAMADDDMKDDEPMEEMAMPPMADDEEMDLEIEDEEEMDMDAPDMGELTLTDEEAEVFLKVAEKVRAAMDMAEPEEMPAPDMGGEVEMDAEMDMESPAEMDDEDEPMMEDMVNEVARRVAKRLNDMKKSK